MNLMIWRKKAIYRHGAYVMEGHFQQVGRTNGSFLWDSDKIKKKIELQHHRVMMNVLISQEKE
jgi:hypothetical protein